MKNTCYNCLHMLVYANKLFWCKAKQVFLREDELVTGKDEQQCESHSNN